MNNCRKIKCTNVVPPKSFVGTHQLEMRFFEKLTTNKEHSRSKQNAEIFSLISENFMLEVIFERYVVMRTL